MGKRIVKCPKCNREITTEKNPGDKIGCRKCENKFVEAQK